MVVYIEILCTVGMNGRSGTGGSGGSSSEEAQLYAVYQGYPGHIGIPGDDVRKELRRTVNNVHV